MDKEILNAINGLNKRFDVVETGLNEVKADIGELKYDVRNLKADMVEVKADISELKADMVEVKADISELKADMVEVKADISELKADMVEVKADISELKADVNELRTDVDKLRTDVDKLKTDMTLVQITLENDIRPSIMRVAEGHLDLNRKLDCVLEFDKEREKLAIQVNYINGEVRRIKKKARCLA